jgi:O-antigen/teichoic acid export membrane protein
VYSAVFRLVDALRLFPAAVLVVALPAMCRTTTLRPVAPIAAGLTVFAAAIALPLGLAAGPLVALLYGAEYAGGVSALRILLLSFPLMSLNYALTQQLIGWNRHVTFAVLCGLALTVNVGANARLIPIMAAEGAAWATVITELVLTIGCVTAIGIHLHDRHRPRSAVNEPRPSSRVEGADAPALEGS